jgi:predicted nucleotidyltransferase
MNLPLEYEKAVDKLCKQLPAVLGDNLFSCVLYGSAVRGNVVPSVSDINILIVLNESTPEAHMAIADCIEGNVRIDPFIITRKGMERSFKVFAIKFRSIKRHYKVLCGEDPITGFAVTDNAVKFLCEQALRNLRLRSVHNYLCNRQNRQRYLNILLNMHTAVFTDVAEILRLAGEAVPDDYGERIPVIKRYFNVDTAILEDLLVMKNNPAVWKTMDIGLLHRRIFNFLNHIVLWMEQQWPTPQ